MRLAPCYLLLAEGLWLPPGPADSGRDAGRVLHHGPAVVRGGHRALHLPRQQPEAGVGELSARRAAALPGHPGAAAHRPAHLPAHGLLRLHDRSAAGESVGRLRRRCCWASAPPSGPLWDIRAGISARVG